ncbi:MAG: GNAT family protein, partial [Candidatus Nanopelagicales bacterium]
MSVKFWPLFDLRIHTPDLSLRPMAESDLEAVGDLLPADVDMDPAATTYEISDQKTARAVIVCQSYWKAFGIWSPAAWRLNFVVHHNDRLIGVQELEGNDFLTLRTVDTASFLAIEERGKGWGKQMRAGVLALAFGELNAMAAITSAYHDNAASLGVSKALGYLPNGQSFLARGDGVDTLEHMRMTQADWQASRLGESVSIDGFEDCKTFFGIPARGSAE